MCVPFFISNSDKPKKKNKTTEDTESTDKIIKSDNNCNIIKIKGKIFLNSI
jgi:hypothetical protein